MAQDARDFGQDRVTAAGGRIRARRKQLGMSQEQLRAELRGWGLFFGSTGSMSNIEMGRGLDLAKIPAFAAVLRCSVTYLVGLTDKPGKWTPDVPPEEWPTRVSLNAFPIDLLA